MRTITNRTWRWKKGHSSRSPVTKGKNEQVVSCSKQHTDSKSVRSFIPDIRLCCKGIIQQFPLFHVRVLWKSGCGGPCSGPVRDESPWRTRWKQTNRSRNAVRCNSHSTECKIQHETKHCVAPNQRQQSTAEIETVAKCHRVEAARTKIPPPSRSDLESREREVASEQAIGKKNPQSWWGHRREKRGK